MKAICCLLWCLVLAFPASADPLDPGEAHRLARTGPPDAVEAAFSAHQAAFSAGETEPDAYRAAYAAFRTTEPKVEATLDAWLAAHPDSPQALAAAAVRLDHLAWLVRGHGYVVQTPEAALREFRRLAGESLELARRALEAEPRHLAAAYTLMDHGAALGSREDRDHGFRVIEELDSPANALLAGLQFNYPRWGGGPAAIRLFCVERAPRVPDISLEECLALADYDHRHEDPTLLGPAVATLSKGSIRHFPEAHIAALLMEGKPREAHELAQAQGYMTYELAYALANSLGDMSIVEQFAMSRLRRDPLRPVDLVIHADTLIRRGKTDAAHEAYDNALRYGAYLPFVRRARIQAIAHKGLEGDLFREISGALEATDYSAELVGDVVLFLMFPAKDLTHLPDGTPRPDFECTRLRILERHEQICNAGFQDPNCEPGMAARRDTILIEGRARQVCGEATGGTWQDFVRYLLELTE